MYQHFKVKFAQSTYTTETLEWEFTAIYQNNCYNDNYTGWTTQAVNIPYTITNTYSASDDVTSIASEPNWSTSSAGS